MRKTILIPILLLLAVLCACSGKSSQLPLPGEIYAEIEAGIKTEEMVDVAEQLLEANTGITAELYSHAAYYIPSAGMAPDQIIIVRAKDSDSAQAVEALLTAWLDYQIESARFYMTENMPLLQSGVVRRDNLTVSLIVSPATEEILRIYEKLR